MKKLFFVNLYFLGLAIGAMMFKNFVTVSSLSMSLRIGTLTWSIALLSFGMYLAYKVTRPGLPLIKVK